MPIFSLIPFWIISFMFLFLPCVSQAQGFPDSWQGKWQGSVKIWSFQEQLDSFPMSLEISRIDTAWTYTIAYLKNAKNPDIRNYSLISLNDSIGHYAIDEHNSIILDAYYNDECLHASFGIASTELLSRVCMEEDYLSYEITSIQSEPMRVSGNEVISGDTIPAINSFKLVNFMKARLMKQ